MPKRLPSSLAAQKSRVRFQQEVRFTTKPDRVFEFTNGESGVSSGPSQPPPASIEGAAVGEDDGGVFESQLDDAMSRWGDDEDDGSSWRSRTSEDEHGRGSTGGSFSRSASAPPAYSTGDSYFPATQTRSTSYPPRECSFQDTRAVSLSGALPVPRRTSSADALGTLLAPLPRLPIPSSGSEGDNSLFHVPARHRLVGPLPDFRGGARSPTSDSVSIGGLTAFVFSGGRGVDEHEHRIGRGDIGRGRMISQHLPSPRSSISASSFPWVAAVGPVPPLPQIWAPSLHLLQAPLESAGGRGQGADGLTAVWGGASSDDGSSRLAGYSSDAGLVAAASSRMGGPVMCNPPQFPPLFEGGPFRRRVVGAHSSASEKANNENCGMSSRSLPLAAAAEGGSMLLDLLATASESEHAISSSDASSDSETDNPVFDSAAVLVAPGPGVAAAGKRRCAPRLDLYGADKDDVATPGSFAKPGKIPLSGSALSAVVSSQAATLKRPRGRPPKRRRGIPKQQPVNAAAAASTHRALVEDTPVDVNISDVKPLSASCTFVPAQPASLRETSRRSKAKELTTPPLTATSSCIEGAVISEDSSVCVAAAASSVSLQDGDDGNESVHRNALHNVLELQQRQLREQLQWLDTAAMLAHVEPVAFASAVRRSWIALESAAHAVAPSSSTGACGGLRVGASSAGRTHDGDVLIEVPKTVCLPLIDRIMSRLSLYDPLSPASVLLRDWELASSSGDGTADARRSASTTLAADLLLHVRSPLPPMTTPPQPVSANQ